MPEVDLLRDVREQFFASYRDAIRELAFEGFSAGRTVWSDQLADVAATLAAARSTVTVAEDVENTGIVDAADDGAADLLAAQVAELKDQVPTLAAQVRNLVRVIDASRSQAMLWLYSPPGQTFLMMITIALALASFIGDRVDAAQDQPPAAPPPAVAPPAMLPQDGW